MANDALNEPTYSATHHPPIMIGPIALGFAGWKKKVALVRWDQRREADVPVRLNANRCGTAIVGSAIVPIYAVAPEMAPTAMAKGPRLMGSVATHATADRNEVFVFNAVGGLVALPFSFSGASY